MRQMAKGPRERARQVQRAFTSIGIPGVSAEGMTVLGVPGWRFIVTTQESERAHGVTVWRRLRDLNKERRTALVRARADMNGERAELGDAQVIVRLGDFIDLIEFRYNAERGDG